MKPIAIDVRGPGSLNNVSAELFLWEPSGALRVKSRPLVIICPGGGYDHVSDREAEPVAMQFAAMGTHTAVLRYSVAPARFPTALVELARLVRTVRTTEEPWRAWIDRVIVCGFSAGRHLAGCLGVMWNEPWLARELECDPSLLRPDAMVLGYPVVTAFEGAHERSFRTLLGEAYEEKRDELSLEKRVRPDTPPTFLWHTAADGTVNPRNSLVMAEALARCRVPFELHIFQEGGHGLSLANWQTQSPNGFGLEPSAEIWVRLAHTWLEQLCMRNEGFDQPEE